MVDGFIPAVAVKNNRFMKFSFSCSVKLRCGEAPQHIH